MSSDRPTPEQIAASPNDVVHIAKDQLLADLRYEGYVIVHPDDVPRSHPIIPGKVYDWQYHLGWVACREAIFAAAEQEPTDD
jgi:hypothetical protein